MEHLQEPEIAQNTLHMAYPYTDDHADAWIEERLSHRWEQPTEVTFALRNPDGRLIGVVGADDHDVGSSHRADVGFWLARP